MKINPKKILKKYFSLYKKPTPWYKRIITFLVSMIVAILLFFGMVDINFLWLFGDKPDAKEMKTAATNLASELYSYDGKLIGKYFQENRSPVEYEQISPKLIKTLISTEDERFYVHKGIDIVGIMAASKEFFTRGRTRGASTLTQQLVKNMFKMRTGTYKKGLLERIPKLRLIIMKIKEWITAIKIENIYTKEQILTMYLNTVDFGSNAFGIKTACKTYFNTTVDKLTWEQSAVLVGLLKATSYYNPKLNPKNSLKRRNIVLNGLKEKNIISQNEYDSLSKLEIKLEYFVESNYTGRALYFRHYLANYLSGFLKENNLNLFTDGLKIYTTIDSTLQVYAEEATNSQMQIIQKRFDDVWRNQTPWRDKYHKEMPNFIENIAKQTDIYKYLNKKFDGDSAKIFTELNKAKNIKVFDYLLGEKDTVLSVLDSIRYMVKFMHAGLVSIEPENGFVRAWVGDIDYNFWKFDKVTAMRQPGSTFKLFDYTAAMESGMSPCDERYDTPVSWKVWDNGKQKYWVAHNADGYSWNIPFSLKCAFARSINTIAVKISQEVGIDKINNVARRLGVKSPLCDTIPATCLGGNDMTLLELTNAYSAIINDGIYQEPVIITKIIDRNNNVIYEHKPEKKQAVDYQTAYLMQVLLRAGMTERGATSGNLWQYVRGKISLETEFGGKTGTSSNHSDAWFMGVTPKLVTGVWVGNEHRCIHFKTGDQGQGNKTSLLIYGTYVQNSLSDDNLKQYRGKFEKPKEKITVCYTPKQYPYPDSLWIDSANRVRDSIKIARALEAVQ